MSHTIIDHSNSKSFFTLAKVTRDRHESERLYNKVERAKTEHFLSEQENPAAAF